MNSLEDEVKFVTLSGGVKVKEDLEPWNYLLDLLCTLKLINSFGNIYHELLLGIYPHKTGMGRDLAPLMD